MSTPAAVPDTATTPLTDPVTVPRRRRWVQIVLWGVFVAYYVLALIALIAQYTTTGPLAADFETYHNAGEAIAAGDNPYVSPEDTRAIWEQMTALEPEMMTTSEPDELIIVGPYVYLPTLALIMNRFAPGGAVFNGLLMAVLLTLAVIGFSWFWLRERRSHAVWLLLVVIL
ncbi:MAG: hypothetical protein AAFV33_12565 [Chloroflexota bacterium]